MTKIAFITARIVALFDFISTVQYMIHFMHHFVKRTIGAHVGFEGDMCD